MAIFSTDALRKLIADGDTEKFYESREWKELAREIRREFHGECVFCRRQHKLSRAVLVHHVKPVRIAPELAYSRTYTDADGEHLQLVPLCFDCHERVHGRGRYAAAKGYQNEEKW